MEFKFESNQQFQLDAIESVVRLFEGRHYVAGQLEFEPAVWSSNSVPNSLGVGR